MGTRKRSRPILAQDANAKLRAAQALELRITGMSQREIAKQVGVSQPQVSRMIAKALREKRDERVDDLRKIDVERMEDLHNLAWRFAKQGDMTAAGVITRLLDRRAKLFGFDVAGANGNGGIFINYSAFVMVCVSEEAGAAMAEMARMRRDWNGYEGTVVYDATTEVPTSTSESDIYQQVENTVAKLIPVRPDGDQLYIKTIVLHGRPFRRGGEPVDLPQDHPAQTVPEQPEEDDGI
jgi:DNA-binding Lrp family transcriptional regulator